ncbi:hypothetical protein OG474_38150 [Kribbella sp. NBC_01505]|uniref:poly(ethylene terephthalate) hydrolase family protein n=1 Tax=Kribbella sp. NBC_01505 TaxID=2903580 RepID=UPI0038666192
MNPRRTDLATLIALVAVQPAVATRATAERYYEQAGPHQVTKAAGGPDHTLYYPTDLATTNSKHPVVLWGNGTGASVDQYDVFLRHLASWGFVVAAANTGQFGTGREILAGGKYLIAENARTGSVFHQRIDVQNIGAAGHSLGGGGTIAAGADPMVKVSMPVQPGPQGSVPALRGPSLFVAGQLDYIVPSLYVRARYSHLIGVGPAWFRYWLTGDQREGGLLRTARSGRGLHRRHRLVRRRPQPEGGCCWIEPCSDP